MHNKEYYFLTLNTFLYVYDWYIAYVVDPSLKIKSFHKFHITIKKNDVFVCMCCVCWKINIFIKIYSKPFDLTIAT